MTLQDLGWILSSETTDHINYFKYKKGKVVAGLQISKINNYEHLKFIVTGKNYETKIVDLNDTEKQILKV